MQISSQSTFAILRIPARRLMLHKQKMDRLPDGVQPKCAPAVFLRTICWFAERIQPGHVLSRNPHPIRFFRSTTNSAARQHPLALPEKQSGLRHARHANGSFRLQNGSKKLPFRNFSRRIFFREGFQSAPKNVRLSQRPVPPTHPNRSTDASTPPEKFRPRRCLLPRTNSTAQNFLRFGPKRKLFSPEHACGPPQAQSGVPSPFWGPKKNSRPSGKSPLLGNTQNVSAISVHFQRRRAGP